MQREAAIRTLEAKGAKPQCPSCGKDEGWDNWIAPPYGAAAVVQLTDPVEPLAVTPLLCKGCGFMRLHSLHEIEDRH